mgnify:CR=1 FL=1
MEKPAAVIPRANLPEKNPNLSVFNCGYDKCAPSHCFGPAVRNHYLIHFILSGCGCFTRGGVTYELGKGDGFLIVPGETTVYCADANDPWEYCWVNFYGADAEWVLKTLRLSADEPLFHCDISAGDYIVRCNELPAVPGRELILAGNLYLFFAAIASERGFAESLSAPEQCVGLAMRYIHDNYSYDISVESIARHVGVSRSHLFRLFKLQNGVSVQRYLLEYRLKMSAAMLKDLSHNISEIGYSCGFTDPNHFSRVFRDFYGMTPSQFRRIQQNAAKSNDKCGL